MVDVAEEEEEEEGSVWSRSCPTSLSCMISWS